MHVISGGRILREFTLKDGKGEETGAGLLTEAPHTAFCTLFSPLRLSLQQIHVFWEGTKCSAGRLSCCASQALRWWHPPVSLSFLRCGTRREGHLLSFYLGCRSVRLNPLHFCQEEHGETPSQSTRAYYVLDGSAESSGLTAVADATANWEPSGSFTDRSSGFWSTVFAPVVHPMSW